MLRHGLDDIIYIDSLHRLLGTVLRWLELNDLSRTHLFMAKFLEEARVLSIRLTAELYVDCRR